MLQFFDDFHNYFCAVTILDTFLSELSFGDRHSETTHAKSWALQQCLKRILKKRTRPDCALFVKIGYFVFYWWLMIIWILMMTRMRTVPLAVSKIHPAHHRRVAHSGKEKHVFMERPSKWKGPDFDENKNKNIVDGYVSLGYSGMINAAEALINWTI